MQSSNMNGTASGAVYVQTNAAPNEVIAFRRADDGSLDRIGSVATGGDGDGSPHLTSQGSVALTRDGRQPNTLIPTSFTRRWSGRRDRKFSPPRLRAW